MPVRDIFKFFMMKQMSILYFKKRIGNALCSLVAHTGLTVNKKSVCAKFQTFSQLQKVSIELHECMPNSDNTLQKHQREKDCNALK